MLRLHHQRRRERLKKGEEGRHGPMNRPLTQPSGYSAEQLFMRGEGELLESRKEGGNRKPLLRYGVEREGDNRFVEGGSHPMNRKVSMIFKENAGISPAQI